MWKTRLQDNREVTFRLLTLNDKNGLFKFFSSMSDEALKWSMAPYTMDVIQRWINNIQNLIPLVAEYKDKIVGYAAIFKFSRPRRKGVGDLVIYLHQDFHNVGLGTVMSGKLLELAKRDRLHKIELAVVAENIVAIYLYEKFGFNVEGVSKDSFIGADQEYHDLVHMGLILE